MKAGRRPERAADAAFDQAAGLRRLFGARRLRFVALVANPFVPQPELVLERLCSAAAALGLQSLVVDAADTAPPPHEMALLDLASCIEPLGSGVSYLAAPGLPLRHVDTHGRCGGFLDAIEDAAPQADVAFVHAGTGDLARMFADRPLRPLLQASDSPHSLIETYAALKRLAQRPCWLAHDLLVVADANGPRTARLGDSLADCAERFLGAVIHERVVVDPSAESRAGVDPALQRLLQAQLAQHRLGDAAPAPLCAPPSAHCRPDARP